MTYPILLFDGERAYKRWANTEKDLYSEINSDINLTHITDNISKFDADFPGHYILYPNFDSATAALRAEIFAELYGDAEKYKSLEEFIPDLAQIKRNTKASSDSENEDQRNHYLLTAVIGYINCIEKLYGIMRQFTSELFVRLCGQIEQIKSSPEYIEMSETAFTLKEKTDRLLDISLNFDCRNKIARLDSPVQNALYKRISAICASILDLEIKTEFSIVDPNQISSFEEDILNVLKTRSPEFFSDLEDFYNKYSAVGGYWLLELQHQFLFYINYIKFVRNMEKKGYVFSLPVLNETRLYFKNMYDLSLAVKRDNSNEIVANDIEMMPGNIFVLSGPNQGGKTTFIRGMSINSILASNGCFVAAERCEIPQFDNLFTHFNRVETIGKRGRLEEELNRIAVLLPKLTHRSLVFFNECFSSTRRIDGVRLAVKLLDKLYEIGCTGGFVTHYYEIAELHHRAVSLVAGVESSGEKDDIRTYKITERPPGKTAYARSIAEKCGVTFEQLVEVIDNYEKI